MLNATVRMTTVVIVPVPGISASSITTAAKISDARPRRPNHPMYSRLGARRWVPIIAIATGSIRTRVRLAIDLTATTDGSGKLWVFVGTDSGFEGLTALYFSTVDVSLNSIGE